MKRPGDNFYVLIVMVTAGIFIVVTGFLFLLFRSRQKLLLQRQTIRSNELEYQKMLLHSIIESQDQERIRIGRDLHDDVGNALAHIKVLTETFYRTKRSRKVFTPFYDSVKTIVDETIANVRSITQNLSPEILTIHTPSEAITLLCSRARHTSNLDAVFTNNAQAEINMLGLSDALALYRILEELITNTIKHANATEVKLSALCDSDFLVISYADNGIGFPAENSGKHGQGMKNIYERIAFLNASLYLGTQPEEGASATIKIPFEN